MRGEVPKKKEEGGLKALVPFNIRELNTMIQKGFTHVMINAYNRDKSPEYVDPHYIVLSPLKLFKNKGEGLGIYEAIQSELLSSWANEKEGVEIWVDYSTTN